MKIIHTNSMKYPINFSSIQKIVQKNLFPATRCQFLFLLLKISIVTLICPYFIKIKIINHAWPKKRAPIFLCHRQLSSRLRAKWHIRTPRIDAIHKLARSICVHSPCIFTTHEFIGKRRNSLRNIHCRDWITRADIL